MAERVTYIPYERDTHIPSEEFLQLTEDIQDYDAQHLEAHKDLNDRQHQKFIDKFPPFAFGQPEAEDEPRAFLKRFRISKGIMFKQARSGEEGRRIGAVTLDSLRTYARQQGQELVKLQKSADRESPKYEVLEEMRSHWRRVGKTIVEAQELDANTPTPHVELAGAKAR